MISLIDAVTAYPTFIFTALLVVVLFYWVLAIIGIVDFEAGGVDVDVDVEPGGDLHADADGNDISQLAGFLVAMGLNGVPFSIVVSLMVLISWTLSCLAGMWVLPLVPTDTLTWVVASGVLVFCPMMALPITARAIRPLRGLFVSHTAISNDALVGQPCRVLTGSVDERFGRAEVSMRGAGINIRIWAETPNTLGKGSVARILEYDAAGERYLVVEESENVGL